MPDLSFEDFSQTKTESYPQPPLGEITDAALKEVDGFTFTYAVTKFGDSQRTAHEVIFTEGDREFHIMPLLDEKGNISTLVQVVSDKQQVGTELQAHIQGYLLRTGQLLKIMDSTIRVTPKQMPSFEETLNFVMAGKHRQMTFSLVEE